MTQTSPLVLGAMLFGTRLDEQSSFDLLDRFVDGGGVWVDTADCYAFWESGTGHGGQSETVLGRWLAARPGARDRVKISTKVGAEPRWPGGWPEHFDGLSTRAVRTAFEGSLRRLGTDHVDLLWWHTEDRATGVEETVDAVAPLVAAGQVLRVGASNHPAWRVERARAHAHATGTVPVDALQLSATYLRPRPGELPPGNVHPFGVLDDELRDYADVHALELWAYTPLLSGAYDNPAKEVPEVYDHPGSTRRLEALTRVAKDLGVARGQVVLAWLLAHGIRPILGGSRPEQLDAALAGVRLELSAEDVRRLDLAA
ncbi:aldo/keto reductase [Kineococcus sp. SYSU DK003]|uniref:aldo/keto reductase n=1 Tax=Kineococcus sp. SYSU DK003 TaxID=3383124 RepID=UPI003D7E39ED